MLLLCSLDVTDSLLLKHCSPVDYCMQSSSDHDNALLTSRGQLDVMHESDKAAQHLQSANEHPADSCTAFIAFVAVLEDCGTQLACFLCVSACVAALPLSTLLRGVSQPCR